MPRNKVTCPNDLWEVRENVKNFLLVNDTPISGEWSGKMKVRDQRRLLGCHFGKRTLTLSVNCIVTEVWEAFGRSKLNPDYWDLRTGDLVLDDVHRGLVDDPLAITQMRSQYVRQVREAAM